MSGTSSFTSTSLADYASNLPGAIDNDPDKKKKSQITGTMLLGGQNGTFNGDLDIEELKQQLQQSSNGYQPPANYGMNQQPNQMPMQAVPPTLPSPSLPPPVGASPITGEFQQPPQAQPIQMPVGNQPYQQMPPNPFANEPGRDSNGILIPEYGTPPPGSFLSQPVDRPQQPQRDPQFAGMPDDVYGRMIADQQRQQAFAQQNPGMPQMRTNDIRDYEQFMNDQREQNQYVSIDGGIPVNPMSQIPMMEKPVAGPIAPDFTQPLYGLNPFANEPGRDGNGMLIPGYGDLQPGTFIGR